jgi:hypothetical protein
LSLLRIRTLSQHLSQYVIERIGIAICFLQAAAQLSGACGDSADALVELRGLRSSAVRLVRTMLALLERRFGLLHVGLHCREVLVTLHIEIVLVSIALLLCLLRARGEQGHTLRQIGRLALKCRNRLGQPHH